MGLRLLGKALRLWKEKGFKGVLHKIGRRVQLAVWHWRGKGPAQDLRVVLDPLPEQWCVGKGNVLYLTGSCYHPAQRIAKLELLANGKAHAVRVTSLACKEVYHRDHPDLDPRGHSLFSGFSVLVSVPECPGRTSLHLAIRARLRNGEYCMKSCGDIALVDDHLPPTRREFAEAPGEATIAICMTTYFPPLDLFTRQVQSIKDQTYKDWICIICDDGSPPAVFKQIKNVVGDDPRFYLHQNVCKLGFYHNFERCLTLVPPEVQYIALSDQDDYWHSDKLATLLAEFDDDTTLVYSDMKIVDHQGEIIHNTYWTNRSNNYRNLISMFLTNTVTGAASLFRRSLLETLLPFPQRVGMSYHDHWIGCTALTLGNVKYIDRPLYDYVQHPQNVIGHAPKIPRVRLPAPLRFLRMILLLQIKKRCSQFHADAKFLYFSHLLRIEILARALVLRCLPKITPEKQKALLRVAHLQSVSRSLGWLWARSILESRPKSVTMGADKLMIKGLWWRFCNSKMAWWRLWSPRWHGKHVAPPVVANPKSSEVPAAGRVDPDPLSSGIARAEYLQQKIAPLSIKVTAAAPLRLNFLIPTIDFSVVFGGYITKFNLARCLAEKGYRVRLITVDPTHVQPAFWRHELLNYPGLSKLLEQVEVAEGFPRSRQIEMHPDDVLLASTWWTAHIANQALAKVNRKKFLYLIQEFEPFTFPMNTYAAMAEQTYTFPHDALFSTEFLRDYFRQNRIGVFARSPEEGEKHSISFQNTITAVSKIEAGDLAGRTGKKLLYYARPEEHASRNMFELGLLGLEAAIRSGHFSRDWEFFGIGTLETPGKIILPNGFAMKVLPRQNQETYKELLRDHDLGLSLMFTPHPSLVPIEMASA